MKETRLKKKYYREVMRLHYEEGRGENRISRILPIGHSTKSRRHRRREIVAHVQSRIRHKRADSSIATG